MHFLGMMDVYAASRNFIFKSFVEVPLPTAVKQIIYVVCFAHYEKCEMYTFWSRFA